MASHAEIAILWNTQGIIPEKGHVTHGEGNETDMKPLQLSWNELSMRD